MSDNKDVNISAKLRKLASRANRMMKRQESDGPIWEGPEGKGPKGGVTYSLLNKFLQCRERFRLWVVEGLRPSPSFNHRIEYGSMWHLCEESYARSLPDSGWTWQRSVESNLREYCKIICTKYPTQQEQVDHWYNVCKVQFPLYVQYWENHSDTVDRIPIFQEKVFDLPYTLPSGRVVRLRGKWDAVDLIDSKYGTGRESGGVYLFETKTKGDVRESLLVRQLTFDLQTMLYLVALDNCKVDLIDGKGRLRGVRYNVIRRPLSGGKGSIVRHKPTKSNPAGESKEHFYSRLVSIIKESPNEFFYRWNVEVTPNDILRFRTECLNPLLENLCDWYDFVSQCNHYPWTDLAGEHPGLHWRHPYGVQNILDEGGVTDYDEYLATGSTVGLIKSSNLFEELI